MKKQDVMSLMDMGRTTVRLHLWLERSGGTVFGMGRLQLLERIETCGSLKAAAEDLGMSYRAAWGKLKASEEALGIALAGAYRTWFAEVERHAVSRAGALFPFLCHSFQERKRHAKHSGPDYCASKSISATQNI